MVGNTKLEKRLHAQTYKRILVQCVQPIYIINILYSTFLWWKNKAALAIGQFNTQAIIVYIFYVDVWQYSNWKLSSISHVWVESGELFIYELRTEITM